MVIPKMYEWNLKKGIGLLATGDWTHPLWIRELKANLDELGNGLLKLKPDIRQKLVGQTLAQDILHNNPLFLLSGEVSCIYSHNGKLRRNHLLLFAPSFEVVERISSELTKRGGNLASDGRPILGLTSQNVCEVVWGVSAEVLVIPAHAWTPWFSLYGSMSGYDSLEECFGSFSSRIYAVETGLSSNPAMNWRIKELDKRTIISCSDAHSGPKLMREATIFEVPQGQELSFNAIHVALKNYQRDTAKPYIAGTIEFYPEEGKYHYSGHRSCNIRWSPEEVKQKGTVCPVCGKGLTIGVANRVEALAGRTEAELKLVKKSLGSFPVAATYSEVFPERPPYIMLVPLMEILAEALHVQSFSQKVQGEYERLVKQLGGEFAVLVKTPKEKLELVAGPYVAEGIEKVRTGDITITPGFDGVFGIVKVWTEKEEAPAEVVNQKEQLSLF